ncbi:MAG: prefoldin subunit alpha [Candidatus Woesearchaeota archaeon]
MAEDKHDRKKEEQNKKLQQKYLELQLLDQQMKQVQKQVEAIEQQVGDIDEVCKSLDELSASKPGSEMFVPISSGIFIRARLEDNKSLAVNVGGSTVVKKDIASTKEMLAGQAADMRKFQSELVEQFEKLAERAAELQVELQGLVGA